MVNNTITERDIFPKGYMKRLLIPLILEQFLAITIGLADTIMVSSSGEAAISGVSLVDQINILLIQTFAALATGGAVIISQYLGRGENKQARHAAKQLTLISFYVSAAIMAICLIFCPQILKWIFGTIEDDVMANCKIYFYTTVLSYPFLALYNAASASFRAMGKSRVILVISLFMNTINVAGNAIFIYGFGFGVFGAAFATLISRIFGGIVMTVLMHNKNNEVYIEGLSKPALEYKLIKRILYIGVPNGIESGMFQVGKLLVSRVVSSLGTSAIAANAAAGTIATVSNIPGMAIGLALVTVVGKAMGAKLPDVAEKYTKRFVALTFLLMTIFNVVIFIFSGPIAGLFSLTEGAKADTVNIVKQFCIISSFTWPLAFTLPNCLRGAGDVKFTLAVSMLSMWLCRVALCYFLCLNMQIGIYGVWYAMYADWIFRIIFFVYRFAKGKWKTLTVV